MAINRREFNIGLGAAAGAGLLTSDMTRRALAAPAYKGPNVIIIRFGGGVRRRETIDPEHTFAPNLRNVLTKRGVLIPDMTIAKLEGVNTSHAEGTLNILTGRYLAYRDTSTRPLDDRLEPILPTLFEYFRSAYNVPSHRALLVNGEDRPQEEFFTYGVHGHYGIAYRSEMLSLHRFKLHKFANILKEAKLPDAELVKVQNQYDELLAADRRDIAPRQSLAVEEFWERWRMHYGDTGLKNPRGDRLLTEIAIRALGELKPQLMMINYQDPDYVHWGNASHYTRAITVIDDGIKRLVAAVDADPDYRGNTVFVITPDCGRDANSITDIPFQHHFNSRAAHETWALVFGSGIVKNRTLDKSVDQTAVAATVSAIMDFKAREAEGDVLSELFA